MDQLLQQLRDIHVPPGVSWWPPAPGYWLILMLFIAAAMVWMVRYSRARTRRMINKELETRIADFAQHGDAERLAQELSVLLRRAAITLGDRHEVAGVTGDAWIKVLEHLVKDKEMRFSKPVVQTLTRDIYSPQAVSAPEDLIAECRRWARALPARGSAT